MLKNYKESLIKDVKNPKIHNLVQNQPNVGQEDDNNENNNKNNNENNNKKNNENNNENNNEKKKEEKKEEIGMNENDLNLLK